MGNQLDHLQNELSTWFKCVYLFSPQNDCFSFAFTADFTFTWNQTKRAKKQNIARFLIRHFNRKKYITKKWFVNVVLLNVVLHVLV